jgi:hypothetical protein
MRDHTIGVQLECLKTKLGMERFSRPALKPLLERADSTETFSRALFENTVQDAFTRLRPGRCCAFDARICSRTLKPLEQERSVHRCERHDVVGTTCVPRVQLGTQRFSRIKRTPSMTVFSVVEAEGFEPTTSCLQKTYCENLLKTAHVKTRLERGLSVRSRLVGLGESHPVVVRLVVKKVVRWWSKSGMVLI